MKNKHIPVLLLVLALLLTACSQTQEDTGGWELDKNLYTTVIQESGENDSTLKYLEIAERSVELFRLLEENVGAFVMDAYNYQDIDGEGTPLYTMNGMDYPQEIDPAGQSIRVSRNYFLYNPIETADGNDLVSQIVYDDLTLNLLVPEKYRDLEDQIVEAYRENFYFEKVRAENDYNQDAGIDEVLEILDEDLYIHIIYVKDGQRYFTLRSDCAVLTDQWIEDPIVVIYTSNIHCNYAHSFLSQWVYFPSDKGSEAEAFAEIQPYVQQCAAEASFQRVRAVYEKNAR